MTPNAPADTVVEIADQIPHAQVEGRSKNIPLQWLRAIAAFMVVLEHARLFEHASLLDSMDGRCAFFGVSLFFSLTGYLMAVGIGRQSPFVFLAHRIVRIYPLYFIVFALFVGIWELSGLHVVVPWYALSLFPLEIYDMANYPLGVEWTLVFEISFYVALFLAGLLGLGRRIGWIGLAWLVFLLCLSPHPAEKRFMLGSILAVPEAAPLAAGLLVPWIVRLKLWPNLLLLAGFAAFLPIFRDLPFRPDLYRWLSGVSAALIIAGIIRLSEERPNFGDNRGGRLFALLGDYSYALYLFHPVLFKAMMIHVKHVNTALCLASIAVAILCAIVLGRLDIWLYAHLKRAVNAMSPILCKGFVLAFLAAFFALTLRVYFIPLDSNHAELTPTLTYANHVSAQLAARKDIDTPQAVAAVAEAAGMTKSDTVTGAVGAAQWINGALIVTGVAVDTGRLHQPVGVAFYQNGQFLGVDVAAVEDPGMRHRYHTKQWPRFQHMVATPCLADKPILVLGFTRAGKYAVLDNAGVAPTCP